ncbi:Uncharacterized membrane protein [Neorhodopirellula lusitana]|uniref:Uncharacterized membrane protein n=2 Tax=Neorhodopirellula lusitana TaxID=445327 RepID=A0ABY1QRM5_9BACT|nr:Uncharacterized membrane protein [Neorhodopirellula lusitana]
MISALGLPMGNSILIGMNVIWGAPEWLIPAAIVASLLIGLTLWNYARSPSAGWVRWLAAGLKITAIVLATVCLLQPMQSSERARPKANLLPILVDRSQSMNLKASSMSESRRDRVEDLFSNQNAWLRRMEQDFDVRGYTFADRTEKTSFAATSNFQLDPANENVSNLKSSLNSISERFSGRPIAGLMLFTDGNPTDLPSADFDWKSMGIPIYPVLPGESDVIADIGIRDISVRQTDFESAPVSVRVQFESTGDERDLVVVLQDQEEPDFKQERKVTLKSGESSGEVTFQCRPTKPGLRLFTATVFAARDREAFSDVTNLSAVESRFEATAVNNQRVVAVDRAAGPYRILYVAGRPNWEFKFLRRALSADAEIQLVGLMRIANKEPKFSFRDQGVSETNSLFRGVDDREAELAQQYDEPVMIRMGVKESEELSDGFPESDEELFAYHAIILDDIEPEFFSEDQLLLLRQFVSVRGGGLLMLGGQESFSGKSFSESTLGELSAVYGPRSSQESLTDEYQFSMTREGMLEPWLRLRDNEADENTRLNELPHLTTVNSVGDVKPGAFVLAEMVRGDGKTLPAIVAHRFGKGRTAAMPLGDLWRWSMHRPAKAEGDARDDPAQMWRQIAHWLVGEVPRRVEARVEKNAETDAAIDLVITVRDEAFLPLDNANIELTVTPIGGEPLVLQVTPDDQSAGVYRTTYWADQPGAYRVSASVAGPDDAPIGNAETGWTSEPEVREFQNLALNRDLLQSIADQTGGKVIDDDELDSFATELPTQKVPVTEMWTHPLWHSAWWMTAMIACLCSEWGIRRWKGLA